MQVSEMQLTLENVRQSSRVFASDAGGLSMLIMRDYRLAPFMARDTEAPLSRPDLEIVVPVLDEASFSRLQATLASLGINSQFLEPWSDFDHPRS